MSEQSPGPYVYGLRTCNADMTAYGGFVWPKEGWVEAPDWRDAPACGGGLHFLKDGEGDAGLLSSSPDAVWMIVRAYASETVDIDRGKSKAKRCEVVFAGTKREAVTRLRAVVGADKRIVFAADPVDGGKSICCGSRSTITAEGSGTTITANGDRTTITTEGYGATITAEGSGTTITANGDRTTITTKGAHTTITAEGYDATITAEGYGSTITANGDRTTITTEGYGATITAEGSGTTITANGDRTTITAKGAHTTITAEGYDATITAEGSGTTITAKGYGSTITAKGYGSTITAGENSCITARWWDRRLSRWSFAQAVVGKDRTLKPDTPYRCENGVWIEVVAAEGGDA